MNGIATRGVLLSVWSRTALVASFELSSSPKHQHHRDEALPRRLPDQAAHLLQYDQGIVGVPAGTGLMLLLPGSALPSGSQADRPSGIVPGPPGRGDQRVLQPPLLSLARFDVLTGVLLRDLTARSHR